MTNYAIIIRIIRAFASIIIIKPPPSMSYKQINRRLSLIVTMASIITEFCSRKFAYSP